MAKILAILAFVTQIISNITGWLRSRREQYIGQMESEREHAKVGARIDAEIRDIADNKPTPEEVRDRLRAGEG